MVLPHNYVNLQTLILQKPKFAIFVVFSELKEALCPSIN